MRALLKVTGPPVNPRVRQVVGHCAHCHTEILEGEEVNPTPHGPIHTDCRREYVSQQTAEFMFDLLEQTKIKKTAR